MLRTAKEPPFTIVCDTREQKEFRFHGLATVVGTLKTGDYSIVGHEHRVAVERKSKADIWMCCATERPRFERCLERLAALERAAVVIECDLRELSIRPEYIQRVTPATVVGSCISWSCKYRLPFYWCDTRAYAERVTVRFLAAFLKHVANAQPAQPPPERDERQGREASGTVLANNFTPAAVVLPTGDSTDCTPQPSCPTNPPGSS